MNVFKYFSCSGGLKDFFFKKIQGKESKMDQKDFWQ